MPLQQEARLEPCWCTTTVLDSPAGPVVVLCVAGEVDLCAVALVESAMTAALARRPERLIVDVSGMTFCCCRGFRLLLDGSTAAARQHTGYALSGASPHADRIWAILRPDGLLPTRYPNTGDALVAAMAGS